MALFTSLTNLGESLVQSTRIWAGNERLNPNFNDSLLLRGRTTTVTGEDVHLVTTQLGNHSPNATDVPSDTAFRLYLGTLALTNSTIDMHPALGTINFVNLTATQAQVSIANESFSDAWPGIFAANTNIQGVRFLRSGVTVFQFGSTAPITLSFNDATNTGTFTLVGNTFTTNPTIPGFYDQIRFYTDQGANTEITSIRQDGEFGSNTIGGSMGTSLNWRNVNFLYTGDAYGFIGNFHNRTGGNPTYTWNNVNIEGNINRSTAESFFNIFSGALNDASVFNNVSFWNGEPLTSTGIRGSTWQTTSNTIYANTLFGPFGTEFNGVSNARMIARYANQGRADLTATNHTGLVTNLDFRSLQQVDTSVAGSANHNWFFDIDTLANVWFVNWLPGRPLSYATHRFVNLFNRTTASLPLPRVTDAARTATSARIVGNDTFAALTIADQFPISGVRTVNYLDRSAADLSPSLTFNSTSDITLTRDGNNIIYTLVGNTGPTGTITAFGYNVVQCLDENGRTLAWISVSEHGAQASVVVATNQIPSPSNTADTEHVYTFNSSSLDNGVFVRPTVWTVSDRPLPQIDSFYNHQNDMHLFFRTQHFNRLGRATSTRVPTTAGLFEDIDQLPTPEYRKYSWLQQTENYVSESDRNTTPSNSWGKLIQVSTPAFNASENDITDARNGGYDLYDGASFSTSTDISDPLDQHVMLSGHANASAARVSYTSSGTRTGNDVPVSLKAVIYGAVNNTNINATNDLIGLPYSIDANTVTVNGTVTLNGTAGVPTTSVGTFDSTATTTLNTTTGGLSPDSLINTLFASTRLNITNSALTTASSGEIPFVYRSPIIDFNGNASLGYFQVGNAAGLLDTTTNNTLINVPDSVPANMRMAGTITFDRSQPNRTLTFDPATDTSQVRLTTTGTGTGELIILGKNRADFAVATDPGITITGSLALTFPVAGRYMIGRLRGTTYSTMLSAPHTNQSDTVTAGQVIQLSGADFGETGDRVVVYYRPNDVTPVNATSTKYRLSRTDFLFTAGDQTITAQVIAAPLIDGVNSAFTPVGSPSFTTYTGGINVGVNTGGDLDLPSTKEFFIWLTAQEDFVEAYARANTADDGITISTRGIGIDARVLVLSRPTGTPQRALTGLTVNNPDRVDASGDPIYNTAVVEDDNHTTDATYIIPLTSGIRDFIVNVVPEGITSSEVAAAVQGATVFTSIDTNVRALRTNRLLGIRPQTPSSGGDFSV